MFLTKALSLFLITCSMLLLLPPAEASDKSSVSITGSKYVYFHLSDMARVFAEKNPDISVLVEACDQETGIQNITKGMSDAFMTMGKMDDDVKQELNEQGITLNESVIGWGGITIVLHPSNTIDVLTIDELRKIFSGEYTNWKQLGGKDEQIQLVSRDEAVSGTEVLFRKMVLHGFPLAQNTIRRFDHDIARAIFKQPGSIADARFTEAVRGKIKGFLKIPAIKENEDSPAVLPSMETVANQTYPLAAPIILYSKKDSHNFAFEHFVTFCAQRGLNVRRSDVK